MRWPAGSTHLRDQAVRAADSVVLNLSEGWERGRHTKAAKNHFRIAKGSAGEVFSCLHILGVEDLADDLRRLGAMLGQDGALT